MQVLSKKEEIKKKAMEDYYFFCKFILQFDRMVPHVHGELCDFITKSEKRKKLILMPRGSFKTSVVTIGYSLWRLMKDPNLRVMISTNNYKNAVTYMRGIKGFIENERFIDYFGELKSVASGCWNESSIVVANRTKVVREPSIMITSVDQVKVGLHNELIILDDVVSNKTIATPEQIQKTIDSYRLLLSILEPTGDMLVVGTRYHYADLYGHLIDNEKKAFDCHIRKAIRDDGTLFFPERLTKEFLAEQKESQDSYFFSCQYQNEPVDEDTAIFKSKWIREYKEEDLPKNLLKFLMLDPAASTNPGSDYSAFVTVGVDSNSNLWVLDAEAVRVTITDFMDKIFEKVRLYNPEVVGLETYAFQKTLEDLLIQEQNRRKHWFPIKPLGVTNKNSKSARIKRLQPFFERNKVFLKKEHAELKDQVIRYPRCKYDDLIDAFAWIIDVMIAPMETKQEQKNDHLTYNEQRIWKELEDVSSRKVKKSWRI